MPLVDDCEESDKDELNENEGCEQTKAHEDLKSQLRGAFVRLTSLIRLEFLIMLMKRKWNDKRQTTDKKIVWVDDEPSCWRFREQNEI